MQSLFIIIAYTLLKFEVVTNVQFPPGDILKVVTDAEGNYYYADGFYDRIQRFDKYGNFKNGWRVDASGGAFTMQLNKNNQIKVITARNEMEYVFHQTGSLLNSSPNTNYQSEKHSSIDLKEIKIPFYLWIFNMYVSLVYFVVALLGRWLTKRYIAAEF